MVMGMAAKKRASEPVSDELVQMTFRIPRSLIAALDEYTEALNEGRGWPKLTRSDVMRGGLAWLAKERPDWEGK